MIGTLLTLAIGVIAIKDIVIPEMRDSDNQNAGTNSNAKSLEALPSSLA